MMFFERFSELCKSKNITMNTLAKNEIVSSATITKWRKGAIPSGETLMKLSDFFNVSTDYLLGRTDQPEISQSLNTNTTSNTQNEISKEDLELLELFHKLSIRKQAEIITDIVKSIE